MQEQSQENAKKPVSKLAMNWPLLRKFETIVFGCMLALLPVFAWKVVDISNAQLDVKNTAVDLVNDLNKAKMLAKDNGVDITVAGRSDSQMGSPAYLIQDDTKTLEEVVLRKGVSVEGSVKFDSTGKPLQSSTFMIGKGHKKTKVLVDSSGIISSP